APVAQLRFGVHPAQHALLVDQEVGAVRVELVLQKGSVTPGDLALEVAQQVLLQLVFSFVFLERRDRIDADRQHDGGRRYELIQIFAERAILGRTGTGERQREKCEQHVRSPTKVGERDVAAGGGRQRKGRCRLSNAHQWDPCNSRFEGRFGDQCTRGKLS